MTDDTEALRAKRAAQSQRFYLVFMEPGENQGDRGPLRGAHFAFLEKLEQSGALLMGGPLIEEETNKTKGSGVFILRAGSSAEVEAMVREDPFVVAGFRKYRIEAWRAAEGKLTVSLSLSERDWSFV